MTMRAKKFKKVPTSKELIDLQKVSEVKLINNNVNSDAFNNKIEMVFFKTPKRIIHEKKIQFNEENEKLSSKL
jgi:hypothetical protein